MNKAVKEEINKRYLKAIEIYEDELKSSNSSLESFINLSFIYWASAFELFEFDLPNNIPDDISIIGGNRYPIILELGLNYYPDSIELNFWQKYFAHISYGNSFTAIECQSIIDRNKKDVSKVPYFFMYLFDKQKFKNQTYELMLEINEYPTAKNLYIKSILGRDFL